MPGLNEETKVPIRWVLSLLAGCAAFTGTATGVAFYFGSKDANAGNVLLRVEKLERAVDIVSAIDRRLFRLEIKAGVDVPQEDRLPASEEHQ